MSVHVHCAHKSANDNAVYKTYDAVFVDRTCSKLYNNYAHTNESGRLKTASFPKIYMYAPKILPYFLYIHVHIY